MGDLSVADEPMSTEQAIGWARGYAAKPEKERRREVQALLDRIEELEDEVRNTKRYIDEHGRCPQGNRYCSGLNVW